MSYTTKWVVALTTFGLVVAVITYALTASIGWTAVGLLAAGVFFNMVANAGRS